MGSGPDGDQALPPHGNFPVVAIGAPAGGLDALEALVRAVPVCSGVAFVIVRPDAPDLERDTLERLARHTDAPIELAADGAALRVDTFYLVPPDAAMIVSGGRLVSAKRAGNGASQPIDRLFGSLADELGGLAIGVLLSGGGGDGALGARAIRDAGGAVVCQAPDTARVSDLPRSALATGAVDRVLAPDDLGPGLLALAADRCAAARSSSEPQAATPERVAALEAELRVARASQAALEARLAALRSASEEQQRRISELTGDLDSVLRGSELGVVFLDGALRIREFTARAGHALGLLPDDRGRRFEEIEHPLRLPESLVGEVLRGGEPVEREVEVEGEGDELYLVRASPYEGRDGLRGVILTLVDVSRLRRAEERARHLSAIVESTEDAVLAGDLGGIITAWNDGATELFGYSSEEAIGQHLSLLVPDGQLDEVEAIFARIARGERVEPFETQRRHKDGHLVETSMTVSSLYDEHGQVVGASAIARDISEHKRAEAEVRRSVALRERFLAMLSHELRNPMAAIETAATLLDQDPNGPMRGRAIDTMVRQSRRMARVLDDVLDVSRMRDDRIELHKQVVDLAEIARGAIEISEPLAAQHGVSLRRSLPGESLQVDADPDRLTQVTLNLLRNAIQHTPRGKSVELRVEDGGGSGWLTVADEGNGIPSDMLERIFEPFVQVDDEITYGAQGLGLGLALARTIVAAHGGEISARSAGIGAGSTFAVRLPALSEARHSAAAEKASAASELVVLVEDDRDNRELMAALLRRRGFSVEVAEDGPSGLSMLRSLGPRVALIDLGLPGMDGLEVARGAREALGDDLYLVALTGHGQQRDREAVFAAGFDQHLVKPIQIDVLVDVLRRVERGEPPNAPESGRAPRRQPR